jgi:hypothetical protein
VGNINNILNLFIDSNSQNTNDNEAKLKIFSIITRINNKFFNYFFLNFKFCERNSKNDVLLSKSIINNIKNENYQNNNYD